MSGGPSPRTKANANLSASDGLADEKIEWKGMFAGAVNSKKAQLCLGGVPPSNEGTCTIYSERRTMYEDGRLETRPGLLRLQVAAGQADVAATLLHGLDADARPGGVVREGDPAILHLERLAETSDDLLHGCGTVGRDGSRRRGGIAVSRAPSSLPEQPARASRPSAIAAHRTARRIRFFMLETSFQSNT